MQKNLKTSTYLREKSDYDDFFVASQNDAERQLEDAIVFVKQIEIYINEISKID